MGAAPSGFSRSPFCALDVVAITRAPRSLASCSANNDTPPEPCVSTVSPARTPASADQAVTAAHGSVAASSKVRPGGANESASARPTLYSVSQPSRSDPYVSWLGVRGPPYQVGRNRLTTRSPTFNVETPGPTSSTSPGASEMATAPGGRGNGDVPERMARSGKLSALAFTRTKTSPADGTGRASSRATRPSRLPIVSNL